MLSFHHSSISFLHSWDCIIIHPLLSFIPSWEWLEWVSDQVIDWWLIDWSELIEWSSDWVDSTELCSLWVWTQLSDSYARYECGLNWVIVMLVMNADSTELCCSSVDSSSDGWYLTGWYDEVVGTESSSYSFFFVSWIQELGIWIYWRSGSLFLWLEPCNDVFFIFVCPAFPQPSGIPPLSSHLTLTSCHPSSRPLISVLLSDDTTLISLVFFVPIACPHLPRLALFSPHTPLLLYILPSFRERLAFTHSWPSFLPYSLVLAFLPKS